MPDDLATRLVTVAGRAAFDEVRKWHVPEANRYGGVVAPMGPTETDVGRTVVCAVLAELRRDASSDMRVQLQEIERDVMRARVQFVSSGDSTDNGEGQ
jgi:hypothetical protein